MIFAVRTSIWKDSPWSSRHSSGAVDRRGGRAGYQDFIPIRVGFE